MGEEIAPRTFTRTDRTRYRRKVRCCLEVLQQMQRGHDVEAGRQMAVMVAVLMYRNPAFRKDLEEARAEVRSVLELGR